MIRLLVVCRANVCRSPLAAAVLARELGIEVQSAGVEARPTVAVCARVVDHEPALRGHRPAPLTAAAIGAADLVLTAEAAQRGAVAALEPSARSRSFTLVEATLLAETIPGRGPADFAGWIRALDDARGSIAPERKRMLRPRRSWEERVSIPDGHVRDERAHGATLEAVERYASRFADLLGGR